jgi:hypothetical protein
MVLRNDSRSRPHALHRILTLLAQRVLQRQRHPPLHSARQPFPPAVKPVQFCVQQFLSSSQERMVEQRKGRSRRNVVRNGAIFLVRQVPQALQVQVLPARLLARVPQAQQPQLQAPTHVSPTKYFALYIMSIKEAYAQRILPQYLDVVPPLRAALAPLRQAQLQALTHVSEPQFLARKSLI